MSKLEWGSGEPPRKSEVEEKEIMIRNLPEDLRKPLETFFQSMAFPWRRDPIGAHPLVRKKKSKGPFSEMLHPESPFEGIVGMTKEAAVRADASDIVNTLKKYASEARQGIVSKWGFAFLAQGVQSSLLNSIGSETYALELLRRIVESAQGSDAEQYLRDQLGRVCSERFLNTLVKMGRITDEEKQRIRNTVTKQDTD